ncbi:MAG: hypothetical protein ABGW81_01305 [Paracoccaceae bacterium]
MTDTTDARPMPEIAELDFSDLKVALGEGFADFSKAPYCGITMLVLGTTAGGFLSFILF